MTFVCCGQCIEIKRPQLRIRPGATNANFGGRECAFCACVLRCKQWYRRRLQLHTP